MSGARYVLTGRVAVEMPPDEAFRLFTPRGEQEWAHGWEPRFPVPVIDDAEPGTVFETEAHGERTTWVVVAREHGRRISYARMTPGSRAGTVTVELGDGPAGGSDVLVTYELTGLCPEAEPALREFADRYPHFLASWERAIATLGER
jgi:hypothetical protein